MNIHPTQLEEIRRVVAEVREQLGDEADEQTVQDTVEGETDVMEIVGALLRERAECIANEKAMEHLQRVYIEKAARWSDRADRIKDTLGRIRDLMGQNIKHPAGNVIVSMRKPAPEVGEVSIDDLPDEFVRVKREPDKTAMKDAFKAGRNVPGVRWGEAKRVVVVK